MKHHNFPPELKTKMRQYFKKLFEVRSALDEQAILNDLDPTLQQEARHKQLRRRAATTTRKSARESSSSVVASFHSVGFFSRRGVHSVGFTTPATAAPRLLGVRVLVRVCATRRFGQVLAGVRAGRRARRRPDTTT
jgi:hypothetical protein